MSTRSVTTPGFLVVQETFMADQNPTEIAAEIDEGYASARRGELMDANAARSS